MCELAQHSGTQNSTGELSVNFRTKKAAREAGMSTLKESRQWLLFPKDSAAGMVVKGETFYAGDECEEILSKTEGQRRGLRLRDGSTPVCEVRNWHNSYEAFRVSDFVPKRQKKKFRPLRSICYWQCLLSTRRQSGIGIRQQVNTTMTIMDSRVRQSVRSSPCTT